MNVKKTATTLILRVLALLLVAYIVPEGAQAQPAGNSPGALDVNPGYAAFQREMYFQRFPAAREGGPTEMGGHDKITDKKSMGPGSVTHSKSGPVFMWPVIIPTAISPVPTKRDEMINDDTFKTFGYPVSDTQFQVIQRYNQNRMLEQAFDPEKIMWASTATAGMQATSAANSAASASVNQAQSAIDFTKKYLTNFTSEAGNRWQKIRDQLFIPMAILLLLPGAVLAQVKAIVSQGSPVLGDTNPFEGILRSIIAIFLIPATFLVINYGIDVSNSITFTIADEYKRIFGTDMYEDAQCAQKRAFPVNPADRNDNAVIQGETPPQGTDTTAWNKYEALTLNLREYDPCAKIDKTRTPDERVRDAKKITRLMMNGANVGLTGTWNVMCAFQMAFLYYLWCMGPIAAALWVWPMQRLRGALPSWIEGVVTLCFWSLFWNTTVLLMACFRGVGDSGTVLMSALNFLANVCVKYAFDFSSLVSQGGASGVSNAVQQAMSGGGAAAGGAGGAAAHPGASAGASTGATPGATPGSTSPGNSHTTAAGLNAALSRASGENQRSGVFGSASAVPGLTGDHSMPPVGSTMSLGGNNNASFATTHGGPNGGTQGVGREAGLPPGADPHSRGAMGMNLAGGPGSDNSGFASSILPASFNSSGSAGAGGSPFSFGSTSSSTGLGDTNLSASSLSSGAGANSLGLHMDNQGHLQVNPDALHNLQNQMHDPNSTAHRELNTAMQALQNGDPRALEALAQQGAQGIGGLDPQTSRALGALAVQAGDMYQQGTAGLNGSDMNAVSAFATGQLGPNGQPAIGFDSNGTLTNNLTGAPIDFSNTTSLSNLALNSGAPLDPSLNLGTTYDPNTGLPSNQTFAQMVADGSMQALPTNGLDGLAHTLGSTNAPSLVDASGAPLPQGAVDAQGHFAPGFTPTSDVYALNSTTGSPIAMYDTNTNTWNATNAQGVANGVTMNSAGDWTAPTASGSVGVTYDNGSGNWMASNAGGNVVYDTNSGQLTTPQGTQVNYDGNSYTAANDSAIRYNQDQNSFVSTTTGAPVATGQDGTWYAQGAGNNAVALNTSDNNLYMAGSSYSSASQVQYSANSDGGGTYSAAGGQVYYDNAKSSFEVANSGAAVSYQNGNWVANDTNNQIAYNTNSHQMEVAGSSAAVQYNQNTGGYSTSDGQISYNSGQGGFQTAGGQSVTATGDQWYASNSNYTVAYDQQNQRFEASGTTQPLSYEQTSSGSAGWTAAGTNGSIQYDTSTGTYATANSQAPVYYSPSSSGGDGGTYVASGTNGSVYYDTNAQTWAGAGSSGQAVAYSYDNQSHTWAPAQGGSAGGDTYRVDASSYTQAQQQQVADQQQYSNQYAQQQQAQAQQQYAQQQQDQQQYQQQIAQQQQQGGNVYYDQSGGQQQQQVNYDQSGSQHHQQVNYDQSANQQQQQVYYDQAGNQHHQQVNYDQSGNQQQQQVYYDQSGHQQQQQVSYDQSSGLQYGVQQTTGSYIEPGQVRTETAGNYGNSYGNVEQPQYLASNAVPHQENVVPHQENVSYHQEAPIEHERAPHPEVWGNQGHTETYNHPASSADQQYERPAQQQPQQRQPQGGGLNAFVPIPAPRLRQQAPQAKAQPHPQPQPEHPQPPEAPVHKKGPMDVGSKQGGYQTDDAKRKKQQELLKESWAEYQEGQGNPEEEA